MPLAKLSITLIFLGDCEELEFPGTTVLLVSIRRSMMVFVVFLVTLPCVDRTRELFKAAMLCVAFNCCRRRDPHLLPLGVIHTSSQKRSASSLPDVNIHGYSKGQITVARAHEVEMTTTNRLHLIHEYF
jgi:hypothetical protein